MPETGEPTGIHSCYMSRARGSFKKMRRVFRGLQDEGLPQLASSMLCWRQFHLSGACNVAPMRNTPQGLRILWTIGGLAAALTLFAAYHQLIGWRTGAAPGLAEQLALVGILVAGSTLLASAAVCRSYQRKLLDLSERVAQLKDEPRAHRLDPLPGDFAPLVNQLEGLCARYHDALADRLAQTVNLQAPQTTEQPEDSALDAILDLADAEAGRSHSGVQRTLGVPVRAQQEMIGRLDPSFHWMTATPVLQAFLGLSEDELGGRSFFELLHPEDAGDVARAFERILSRGEGHNITFRVVTAPGKEYHLQMDALARYRDDASPLHLRCHFLDITQKVRTQQELRQRTDQLSQANDRLQQINRDLERLKESYRDLYHQAPVMYFSLDPQGRFAAYNETLVRSLGYQPADLYAQPYAALLAGEARERFLQQPEAYQQAGEIETRWHNKDGQVIDVWIRTVPVLDGKGRFVRSRSAALDMTERIRLRNALRSQTEELQLANEELRRINRELDDFTYVVSHDLKEPLRTVQVFGTFLAQDCAAQLSAQGQEYIAHMVQASRRLGLLIDDLLTLSRAGRILNTPHVFDLNVTVARISADLAGLIQHKGATVRTEGSLPLVSGDPPRVAQLLTNLVSNALKYNTNPHPEVVIGVAADPPPALVPAGGLEQVVIFVRDNGIGIDPQYHRQIFGIFRRLHLPEEYEGTGAGLAICKKIVEAHGGRIWVESEPGKGATFFFTLTRPRPRTQDRAPVTALRPEDRTVEVAATDA